MVFQTLGPCKTDLLVTCLNHQLPAYISWRSHPFIQEALHTSQAGQNGLAGVVYRKWIPFHVASHPSAQLSHQFTIGLTPPQSDNIYQSQSLMRGIYNSRPLESQYSNTWDIASVLAWLKGLGDKKDLSLKKLSEKLAFLLALVSASQQNLQITCPGPSLQMLLCGKCSVPASPTYQEEKVQDPSKRMFLRILYRRWPPLGSVPLHVQGYYNKVSKHAGWGSISTVPLPCTTSQTGDITKDGPQGYLEGGRSRHQHLLSSFSGRSICLGNSGERSVHCRCMLKTANWSRESTFKQLYHRSPARPETDSAQYFK